MPHVFTSAFATFLSITDSHPDHVRDIQLALLLKVLMRYRAPWRDQCVDEALDVPTIRQALLGTGVFIGGLVADNLKRRPDSRHHFMWHELYRRT